MQTHTPGPWTPPRYYRRGESKETEIFIWGGWPLRRIARLPLCIADAEAEANMRLIAAAPELLGALEKLDAVHQGFAETVRTEDWGEGWLPEALPEVRGAFLAAAAAIARAKGTEEN